MIGKMQRPAMNNPIMMTAAKIDGIFKDVSRAKDDSKGALHVGSVTNW